MLKEQLAPFLRQRGFRKQRNRFSRPHEHGWHTVDFQASQWSSKKHSRFTVNLALTYPELRIEEDAWTEKKPPPEYKAHIRERLGVLMPGSEDQWWEIDSDTDLERLSQEVISVLQSVGLPWLDERADLRSLLASIPEDPKPLASLRDEQLRVCLKIARESGPRESQDSILDELHRRAELTAPPS